MSTTSARATAPSEPASAPDESIGAEELAPVAATSDETAAAVQQPAEQPKTSAPNLTPEERAEAAARIRRSTLPPAMRERLAALVESNREGVADGFAIRPLEESVKILEETLADFLFLDRATGARPQHPAGEAFFQGNGEELSDAEAEALAQQQLSRSGMLRGQRVRVAD